MAKNYLVLTTPNTPDAILELSMSSTLGFVEDKETLQAWFAEGTDLEPLLAKLNASVDTVAGDDWTEKWKEKIEPVRVGPITIVPPWLAGSGRDPLEIIIEPEMAFGTGDHATTRACLALLLRNVRPGSSVLDFGCGSGILAIAAAKLGAASVLAIDNDANAVRNAMRNAEVNDVPVKVRESDEVPDGEFDLIVANIQSSVLLPRLEAIMRAPRVILSGLLLEEHLEFPNTSARIIDGAWETFEIGA